MSPCGKEYLDFFESPEAVDVVLLASEVKQVHGGGNARTSRAIRGVYNDRRRACILFANEHCRATAVPSKARGGGGGGAVSPVLSQPVLSAAAW